MRLSFCSVGATTKTNNSIVNDSANFYPTPVDENCRIFRLPTDVSNQYSTPSKPLQCRQPSFFPANLIACPTSRKSPPPPPPEIDCEFFCPRCKQKAYLFQQFKNHAKVVCLQHGSQLVFTRKVGGGENV